MCLSECRLVSGLQPEGVWQKAGLYLLGSRPASGQKPEIVWQEVGPCLAGSGLCQKSECHWLQAGLRSAGRQPCVWPGKRPASGGESGP